MTSPDPDPTDYVFKQDLNNTGLLEGPLADLSGYQGNYGYIQDLDTLKRFLDKMATEGRPIAFDIETGYTGMDAEKRSLDPYHPDQMIVGFSMTNDTQMARYVPLLHDMADNLDPVQVWPLVREVFEEADVDVVAHNMGFELRNLRMLDKKGHGPSITPSRPHDTMLQSYVIGQSQLHGLKALSKHWFNYDQRELEDLVANYAPKDKNGKPKLTAKDKAALRFNRLPLDHEVQQYVCDDVTWAWRLDNIFRPNLGQFGPGLDRLYHEMEIPIMQITTEMSEFAISVDWDGIRNGLSGYHVIIANMEREARRLLAELVDDEFSVAFNFASPKQVGDLLFKRLGLTPNAYTDTGAPSTSEGTLESLRREHPIVDLVLKLRQAKKMGQWFEQWTGYETAYDHKVHPSLNQIKVQSGRFASDNPNIQNITKKWSYTSVTRDWQLFPLGKDGDEKFEAYVKQVGKPNETVWSGNARDFLVASPGYRLLSFDYSAQEMRVLAGLTQDPYLLESFAKGIDVHKTAASLMYHVDVAEVTDAQRQRGKGINFGLVYGRGPKALADDFGIPLDEAKALIATYFSAFTSVESWINDMRRQGHSQHKIISWYGRQSTLWDLFSANEAIQAKAARMCINLPVQGGGADITKLAMLRARCALVDKGWWGDQVKMLMNQHDSLVFEVHESLNLNEVIELLEPEVTLQGVPELANFPDMVVDWEFGHRWGSLTKYTPDAAQLEEMETPRSGDSKNPDPTPDPEPAPAPTPTITQSLSGGTMIVRFAAPDATFAVELTDADGQAQFGEEWERLNIVARFGKLSALAELFGSDYLFKHNRLIDVDSYDDPEEAAKASQAAYREVTARLAPVLRRSEPAAA